MTELVKPRCLRKACPKILTGGKSEIDGYCRAYCRNLDTGVLEPPAPVKKQKRRVCVGIDIQDFITALRDLCESESARRYPLGKRSAFYEIYNRGIVPNLNKDKFSDLYKYVNEACENGDLDDDYFEDTSRKLSYNSGEVSVADALQSQLEYVELNHWADQPVVPMILCEKDGHQGVLARITSPLQVRLFTSKGTWSRSSLIKVAKAVEFTIKEGKRVAIGYIGDHDPAGLLRIERTARDGNTTGQNHSIGLRQHLEALGITDGWSWERIALTTEQFKHLNKDVLGDVEGGDTCNSEYTATHGNKRADVEALGFDRMRSEVQRFIELHTDKALWAESQKASQSEVLRGKVLLSLYTCNFCPVYQDILSKSDSEMDALSAALKLLDELSVGDKESAFYDFIKEKLDTPTTV